MGALFAQLNAGVRIGLALQVFGRIVVSFGGGFVGWLISLVGLLVFVWGCMGICQEKGYSKWLGLLGFFSCLGLLIVMLLPEKS